MCLFSSEYELEISFEDLDPMNIVWHGNYVRYMEQARCKMLKELNYTYLDMNNDGYGYPVAKMKTKFIKPATFGDILRVHTEVHTIEPSLNIKYFIFNKKTGEKIFEAETMQIGINLKTGESIYTPPEGLVKAIERIKK